MYRQIQEQIRRLVASGQLAPGTPLPSVREVAVEHSVNPMTVSKAYNLLEAEGLLDRNRGKVMTVATKRRSQGTIVQRLQQIDEQVEQLVFASRQLELEKKDVLGFVSKKWEDQDA
jgi:GntR family transcriptional regulator